MKNNRKKYIFSIIIVVCMAAVCVFAFSLQTSLQEDIYLDELENNVTYEEILELEPTNDTPLAEENNEAQRQQEGQSDTLVPKKIEKNTSPKTNKANEPAPAPSTTVTPGTSAQQNTNPFESANNSADVQNNPVVSATFEAEVVALCNAERAKAFLPPLLSDDSKLQQAVDLRATEIKTKFSHTRPNGTDCFTVLQLYGITVQAAGENIAYGQKTPSEVVKAWMNSEGHRANILSNKFNYLSVGRDGTHWVQLFIKK